MHKLGTNAPSSCTNAQMKDWDDLRFFLAVAQAGSVTAAAQSLGVNHSTVSRRITAFEERVAVRLFDRLPSGYRLTAAGAAMFEEGARIESAIDGLNRGLAARDNRISGELRVSAPVAFSSAILMPHLDAFMRAYPDVEVHLHASDEMASLNRREADIAIRSTSRPSETLIGRRLFGQALALYASSSYLRERKLSPETLCAQDVHDYVLDMDEEQRPQWIKEHYPKARLRCRIDGKLPLLAAVRQGIGIGRLPCAIADSDPQLQRIAPFTTWNASDVWILIHRDLRNSAKIKTFMSFITNALRQDRDLFEGDRLDSEAQYIQDRR